MFKSFYDPEVEKRGEERGEQRGIEKGIEKGVEKTARNLLCRGFSVDFVV